MAHHVMKGLNSLNVNDTGFVSTDFGTLQGAQWVLLLPVGQ
jgi:hypothetical protein